MAKLPVRGSQFAAGFDLASAYDIVVPARGKALVKTDLAIAIPEETYARIAPRSGLAWKNFIDTGAGVVDYDYRGNVGVILFNHGPDDFQVNKGDRVAQLILERISMASVEEVQELTSTDRGAGGFGSTGVNVGNAAQEIGLGQESACAVKRIREASAGAEGDMLLFLHEVAAVIGETRKTQLKAAALECDSRLFAAMSEYRCTSSDVDLVETLDIIIKTFKDY